MEQEHHRALALAACTEEERQQAMARFAVLQPHLNEGVLVAEAARHAGVPLRSVQRWLARYRAAGLVGLVRATRSDMGKRKLPAELVALVEGMALRKPRPSIAAMHRRMIALATFGWRWVGHLEKIRGSLDGLGERAEERCERDETGQHVNEIGNRVGWAARL